MSNYYLLRMMNHERETAIKLFEDNYIFIGYRDFDKNSQWNYIEKYNKSIDKDKLIEKMINECGWDCNRKQITSHKKLNKFFQFKIGDTIIIPDTKSFHIVKIIEDIKSFHSIKEKYISDNSKNPDIGFVYKVEKIKDKSGNSYISREKFAESRLTARLKAINGLLDINDLKKDIEKSKEAFISNKVIKIDEILKENLREIVKNTILKTLEPNKFENFIKKLMRKLGASQVDIPSKNNKTRAEEQYADVDVIAMFENIKHIIYIQAKFHKGESSKWAVKQLEAYNGEKDIDTSYSTSYWAITSGVFSDEAKKTANDNDKVIRLIDGDELANIILEVGVEGFSDIYD